MLAEPARLARLSLYPHCAAQIPVGRLVEGAQLLKGLGDDRGCSCAMLSCQRFAQMAFRCWQSGRPKPTVLYHSDAARNHVQRRHFGLLLD